MLQIRLTTKGSSGDVGGGGGGGGAAARPPPPTEAVTVACPDHLIIADLPVAKSVGAVTSSSAVVRTVGRRSRRNLGERVHICVRCDFPIAIYGRLVPCDHAFCLMCARSDPNCYLCEERIQKIQSIKMMEGIFICAAPHCLKSFLKRSEFEAHIHEAHSDLLQSNSKKEDVSEKEARASSTDTHKQSLLQETSTARAPSKSGFSQSMNSQQQDRDDRTHRQPSDYQLKSMTLPSPHHRQPGDMQADSSNLPQGSDKSSSWINQPQGFMSQNLQVSDQSEKHSGNMSQSSFLEYTPLQPPLPPNYQLPVNPNQTLVPPAAFTYPLSADGSQQYYSLSYEMPRQEQLPAGGAAQGSVLGFAPSLAGMASFAGNAPRPWVPGQMIMPLDPSFMLAQASQQGYMNLTDSQGRITTLQGDGSQTLQGGWLLNQSQLGQDPKLQAQQPVSMQMPLPPPPPMPLPTQQQHQPQQQLNPGSFSGFNQEGGG